MNDPERTETRAAPAAAAGRGWALRPGRVLAGRFRILRRLGHGGTGVVFAALDELVGGEVAIKVLHPHLDDPASRERLRREVRATRSPHPHLVAVYDLHRDGELWFLSMELVRGESLRARLDREGRLPVGEAVRVGREVAEALAHLHGLGLVHRDVKPGNVLLEAGTGRARLADAGLARPLAHGETVTEARMVVGTPAYMAPEQATGAELTGAADVYALGITLYRALTGEVPLEDRTALSTLMLRQRRRPPPVRRGCPGAPRWLERLLARMTDPDPGERPPAARVARALARGRFVPLPRRRTLLAAALAAAAAAAAGLGLHAAWTHRTVRVEVTPAAVRGVDRYGRETWRLPLGREHAASVRADLDGDGRPDCAVAAWNDPGAEGGTAARVAAVRRDGTVLTDVAPADVISAWRFPYRPEVIPEIAAADLDGDGAAELVVACRHPTYYPSALLLWWPRPGTWETALEHAGNIYAVEPLPGAGRRGRLAFLAVNNRLGMQLAVGVLEVAGPPPAALGDGGRARLGVTGHLVTTDSWRFRLATYVPLGEVGLTLSGRENRIERRGDGGLAVVTSDGRERRLDRFFNPVPGPNAGRDLVRLRRQALVWLVNRLAAEDSGLALTPAAVRGRIESAREALGPLLAEAPYRALLAERGARLLAAAGDLGGALALLAPAVEEIGTDELRYLEANLLAVTGRLDEAAAAVARLRADPHSTRGTFDAQMLALDLAVERRDPGALAHQLARLTSVATAPGRRDAAAFAARAHLWWDALEPGDLVVESGIYTPEGDAVAVLARWRAGRLRPDDLAAARRAAREHPEAEAEALLAEAAALLGRGDAALACERLAAVIPRLERRAATEFRARQLLHLARGLEARALLAAGDPAAARRHAEALLAEATPGLLPWRLARETAEAARRSGR